MRHTVSTLIDAGYYPAVIVLLLLGLTTLYHLAPPRRLPWRRGCRAPCWRCLIFLGGSAGLRAYIRFILDHNHAYGTLAAPIAALLFFFVLALGVLLGRGVQRRDRAAEAAQGKPPRVLRPAGWQVSARSARAASRRRTGDGARPQTRRTPRAVPTSGAPERRPSQPDSTFS